MDCFAIASYGTYPTPTPTGAARAAFAVSMGLVSWALGEDTSPASITVAGLYPVFFSGMWCCEREPKC